jgi:glycosyltransferase involved in cell wall biosynthesis
MPALYSLATCLVYPSLYEAFGLVQLEAMACGCPVLGARAGAIPEITGDAALLFEATNPDDLASALQRVIGDAELRATLVQRGLERASEFTWESCAAQTLAVLQDAAGAWRVDPGNETQHQRDAAQGKGGFRCTA